VVRSPEEFQAWATSAWGRRFRDELAVADPAGEHPWSWSLRPPTESEAARDTTAVASWVTRWRRDGGRLPGGVRVDWVVRRWRSLGAQRLPIRVQGEDFAGLAAVAGHRQDWDRGTHAVAVLRRRCAEQASPGVVTPLDAAIRRHGRALVDLDRADLSRLVDVVDWFVAHPDSGLFDRELPVNGLDTKWLEHHRTLVSDLVAAVGGPADLGLRAHARPFAVRFLDAALAPGAPRDFAAPVDELDRLAVRPSVVWMVENLTTLHAFPMLDDAVAVHGGGYRVVELAGVGWIRAARVVYWGDLDTHGFAILSRLRQHLPQVESVLMDSATLAAHAHLAGTEPRPVRGEITHLTFTERQALAALRDGDRRLEQERIPWPYATDRLAGSARAPSDRLGPAR